jgi:hypothetical protein
MHVIEAYPMRFVEVEETRPRERMRKSRNGIDRSGTVTDNCREFEKYDSVAPHLNEDPGVSAAPGRQATSATSVAPRDATASSRAQRIKTLPPQAASRKHRAGWAADSLRIG